MIVDYIVIENVDGRQHIETWMGETEDTMRLTSVSTLPSKLVPGIVRGNLTYPHMRDEHGREATFRPPDVNEATLIAGSGGARYDRPSHVAQVVHAAELDIVTEREAARLLRTSRNPINRGINLIRALKAETGAAPR